MLASHFKWLGWFRRWVYGMGCSVGIALLPNATGTQFCPKWGPNFESDVDSIAASVFVFILIGFDKYNQKQIQISLMVRRAGLSAKVCYPQFK